MSLSLSLRPIEIATFLTTLEQGEDNRNLIEEVEPQLHETSEGPQQTNSSFRKDQSEKKIAKPKRKKNPTPRSQSPITVPDPLKKNYLSSVEVRMMLLVTALGVALILGVYMRLQTRRVRSLKDK